MDFTILTVIDAHTGEALWSDWKRWGYMLVSYASRALVRDFRLTVSQEVKSKGDRGVLSVRYFTFSQKGREKVSKLFRNVGAMLAVNAGAALMLGLLSVPMYGQLADGFIGGMARDSASGKPVPKVQIVAHNIAQGTDHSTATDADGMYEFTNLAARPI